MESLAVIVGHVLRYDVLEMALAEEDEVAQAFVFDRSNEALSMWIAVWMCMNCFYALAKQHQGLLEDAMRVAYVEEVGFAPVIDWKATP